MFADEKSFKQMLFQLQVDSKQMRLDTFKKIQEEFGQALLSVPFHYLEMMQLWKGFWLLVYKEDKPKLQEKLAEDIAKLIHQVPTKQEFLAQYGLNSEGEELNAQKPEQNEEMEEFEEMEELPEEMPEEIGEEFPEEFNEEFEEFEEFNEHEEKKDDEEMSFVEQQLTYKGFSTLFFQCALETFIREINQVDCLRLSKFYYLVRQTVYQAILMAIQKDQLECIIEQLDQLIFNMDFIKQMQTPQILVIHVLDIWNDLLRFLIEQKVMTASVLKYLMLPIIRFTLDVPSEYTQIISTIQCDIFNDFTDTTYKRDQAIAQFLQAQLTDEEMDSRQLSEFPLQDAMLVLSSQGKFNQNVISEFAAQIQEYQEFFQTPEYDKQVPDEVNSEGQQIHQQEMEEREANQIISRENVRMAKRKYGKEWINHVYKQDGIVHITKDNVKLARYEDDYLPKKYQHLEEKMRDIGNWDDIDEDGNDIK